MREIRTSGSMSGEGKRGEATWPKSPRPSSTLLRAVRHHRRNPSGPAVPGLRGRTTLSDSRPARHACHDVGVAISGRNGPPPITRTTFLTCRAHYPGGSERVHTSVASPLHAAFPDRQAGRHPQIHFRGLLRLHSRYGPLGRSTAQGGLCHEASKRPVTRSPRSLATRSTDNYLGGSFLHWCSTPSGRTVCSWLGAEELARSAPGLLSPQML